MRSIVNIVIFICSSFVVLSQDTVYTKIDTILCLEYGESQFFTSPYDTLIYTSKWIDFLSGQVLDDSITIDVIDLDSILLLSEPLDSLNTNYLFDSIYFEKRLIPEIELEIPLPTCFENDSLKVINKTLYQPSYTSIEFLDSLNMNLEVVDSCFSIHIENGGANYFKTIIDVPDCKYEFDTLTYLSSKLQPTVELNFDKTCENQLLKIQNNSTDLVSNAEFRFLFDAVEYVLGHQLEFEIPDTFPDGILEVLSVVDNLNGCTDTLSSSVLIDSVSYVDFFNLEMEYCAIQDSSLLVANIQGGLFEGPFINDLGNGTAVFVPKIDTSDIAIKYSYTNTNNCTDSVVKIVENIHAKPEILLLNLNSDYCAGDSKVNVFISENNGIIYSINVFKENENFGSSNEQEFLFDPKLSGHYTFNAYYEDINSCFDSLQKEVIVHQLPEISLDSVITIIPGESIEIGSNTPLDSDVEFDWSNGSNSSSIVVSQPGIYILKGQNIINGCFNSDSIIIQYDKNIEKLLNEIKIAPNPFQDELIINLSQETENLRLLNVFGEVVFIDGRSSYRTDSSGSLTLNTSNLSSGYYYLQVPNSGNFLVIKL